jgi:hypothetical protein
MIRWVAGALVAGLLVLGFVAWKRSMEPVNAAGAGTPVASSPESPGSGGPAPDAAAAPTPEAALDAAGIRWRVPAGWRIGDARAMRLATYFVGGSDPQHTGECAVFHFGPGMGGGVDENIDRWVGQFEATPGSARRQLHVHGLDVARVEIAGTFLAPGADMQSQAQLRSWKLLGAIVEGPQGSVFFKLTGPAGVIDRAAPDFDALLASLEKR